MWPSNKSLTAWLGYDLDLNVSDSLIFTEIARQPNSLLFLPTRVYCTDKIKLVSVQRNGLMQEPNSGFALGFKWDDVADDDKTINDRVANKNYNSRGFYVVFEVKYFRSGSVKKDAVNANPI